MTPFDALAAAIRERLTAGRPAPLPGLGTLVRQHVSARVEERADGTRVLLPPGETIGLAPTDDSHESLAPTFGRLLAVPDREVPRAYADAADQLEARLAATGEVRLPGVGLLRRTSGGVILGVEAELLAAVNRVYEGLSPVGPSRTDDAALAPPPPAPRPSEPTTDEPTAALSEAPPAGGDTEDAEPSSAETDPFMIGLPPVAAPPADAPEPLAAPLDPAPAETEATPSEPDAPADSAAPDPQGAQELDVSDDAIDLPVAADPSEFGFAQAPDTSLSSEPPPSEPTDAPAEDDPYGDVPDADGGDVEAEDEPLPEPFDPGDLSTEPLLASDLVPAAVEPPEPEEPRMQEGADEPQASLPDDATEDAFVDDDTLDADLDDVLAVPFGRPDEESIAEILPPSAPESDPADTPHATDPTPDDDDWMAETWTAAESAPPPVGLGDDDTLEIEDAEVIDDTEEAPDAGAPVAPAPASDDTVFDDARAVGAAPPPADASWAPDENDAPPHSPDEEFEALLASPPARPSPEPPAVIVPDAPADVPEAEPAAAPARRSPWGWIVAVVLLAAVVAAAVWLWPRLSGREAPPDVVEAPAPAAAPAVEAPPPPAEDAPVDSLAAAPAESASPSDVATEDAAPEPPAPTAAAPAPRGARAFAAPRLEGLDDGDRRTLVGPPIDPSMGGWTLVVASLRSEEAAAELAGRYRAAGYRTGVFPPSGRTVTRYRIGVGQFGSRDQARRLLDRVFEYEPGGTWPLNLRTL